MTFTYMPKSRIKVKMEFLTAWKQQEKNQKVYVSSLPRSLWTVKLFQASPAATQRTDDRYQRKAFLCKNCPLLPQLEPGNVLNTCIFFIAFTLCLQAPKTWLVKSWSNLGVITPTVSRSLRPTDSGTAQLCPEEGLLSRQTQRPLSQTDSTKQMPVQGEWYTFLEQLTG